jgi:hypothetical protein
MLRASATTPGPAYDEHKRQAILVPSENLIRWIRSRKENRIMIETDGDLLQTSARIYVGLLSFA